VKPAISNCNISLLSYFTLAAGSEFLLHLALASGKIDLNSFK